MNNGNGNAPERAQPQFSIQRIYIKDISFESPQSPLIFKEAEWAPAVNLDLQMHSKPIDPPAYEVMLRVTVTSKLKEESAFVVEVEQAGIFTIHGMEGEALQKVLGSFCPNILYPYARETVSRLVQDGGFPPLYLSPVNFDVLYEEHQKRRAKEREEQKPAESVH